MLGVLDDLPQLERRSHAHGDMVFFSARSRHSCRHLPDARAPWPHSAERRRRHAQSSGRRKRRACRERNGRKTLVDIRIDEPVDAAFADAHQIGQGDGRVIERQGQRRAMEVAAGENLASGVDIALVRRRSADCPWPNRLRSRSPRGHASSAPRAAP